MKILVDKIPKSGEECLFSVETVGDYGFPSGEYKCGFCKTRCLLDYRMQCEYLSEIILSCNNEVLKRGDE